MFENEVVTNLSSSVELTSSKFFSPRLLVLFSGLIPRLGSQMNVPVNEQSLHVPLFVPKRFTQGG